MNYNYNYSEQIISEELPLEYNAKSVNKIKNNEDKSLATILSIIDKLKAEFVDSKFYYEYIEDDDIYLIQINNRAIFKSMEYKLFVAKISEELFQKNIGNIMFVLDYEALEEKYNEIREQNHYDTELIYSAPNNENLSSIYEDTLYKEVS